MAVSEDAKGAGGAGREPRAGAGLFSAAGEIGPDLAAVDWAATPLGPPGGWPQNLRTAVDILLSSRFPMWMAWGPELTFFCNAAYRRDTLGRKYPWALGRPASEVWAEAWDAVAFKIETVLGTGEATWDEGLLLFLERSGYPEETYHTFSYSPLRDDARDVVGMLCVVNEDTERVIGERRMTTLRDLGSDPSMIRTEEETLAFADRQLDRNRKDLPFTLTYLFEDGGTARLAGATGVSRGHPAAPAGVAVDEPDAIWPVAALARGESVLMRLDDPRFGVLPSGDWTQPPDQALLVPLLRQGRAPYGFLVAALNPYRQMDEAYRGFVELAAGHIAAGIGGARGYQAQRRRAEELAELDRAKTTFFSNISHEFRTPLTLIMGPVQELRTRLGDAGDQVHQELDVIHRNGLRLGRLVNSLLDFSRIEAGRMQARYEPVDLAEVTAELASVFRSAVDKAGLAFAVECDPLPEPVYVDRDMWEKVMLNLLSNALKFTFDGAIHVRVGAVDGMAQVTVADTGVGVAADEVPRLFERFHRVEHTRARSNEGSGIGLALVKELVGLHGGTITAASTEGEGTRFTVRLPFGSDHLPPDAVAPPRSSTAASVTADPYVQEALRWLPAEQLGGDPNSTDPTPPEPVPALGPEVPARVLVADDNADMREYLTRLLRGAGYQVDSVADGRAALEAVRETGFDMVVSDVMMPHVDGLELVAALRADQRTAALPVLLLSARAGQEASIEGLRAGADDYLLKPFAAAELLARVRANVELARLRGHHARWRTALVESMQEAFFVCDEDGSCIEFNTAFTDILGYEAAGLPYPPEPPWWPDEKTDPEARREVAAAFADMLVQERGTRNVSLRHRDGHRVWVSVAYNHVHDPETGRRVIVGTFRDVTADHYAIQRESALAALGMRLTEAVNLPDTLAGALEELRDLWHADRVLAAVFTGGPPELTSTEPGLAWQDLPEERREEMAALREHPTLTPVAEHATAITLEHPRGTLVLWIDLNDRRPFTDQDRLLLSLLAGRLAQGLSRANLIDQQRETALALQRAILGPSELPDGFAVRYEPAARPLEVGGDWYDIFALPDGRIGIIVGDCVGRGLEAATVMGQLRSACRALLLQDAGPARTLTALDRFAAGIPGARCSTVFCGVLDPRTGELTYSSAGHPPAILAQPDGTTELLDGGRSVPIAVGSARPRPVAATTIPARATVLLYTDGLVERRRRSLYEGIRQVGDAVQDGREQGVDELATRIMTSLAPPGGYDDDVALMLYRHPAPLDVSFPAESSQLAPLREALRGWLAQCQLPRRTAQGVLVAAGEACANAVEHGRPTGGVHTIRLRAEAFVDQLHLTIADTGRWKPPGPDGGLNRGRGTALMRALMSNLTITPGPDGTTVHMNTRIGS
ncbi:MULTISPECIES: SpoIIE family protein phosphatase [unclassified Actinomadura]|uniref:SpoIIE family protein phosphatase n=1 Tax=unclassified Actinomadura TaxID=2626254 RepID=UPI00190F7D6C|nr:SpoIIE family protein phosphatase [Actinomadura sp. K4S16]